MMNIDRKVVEQFLEPDWEFAEWYVYLLAIASITKALLM